MYKLDNSNGASVYYVKARNDRDGNPRAGWHITVRWHGFVDKILFVPDHGTHSGVQTLKETVDIGMRDPFRDFPFEKITVREFESLYLKNRI